MDHNSLVRLREKPIQHKKVVRIGCGAGFSGDRPAAALNLLLKVQDLDYLVLECLAERTLALRYEVMMAGGKGYDPRITEWMQLLLPEALKNKLCIITNMGAADALGAQEEVLKLAEECGLRITVGVAWEIFSDVKGSYQGSSTYLGAAPIVHLLETSKPDVIITSRLADAALFLGPMVYELGWNWDRFEALAQGTLAGHLLECGCQVTGGYFMHPADLYRDYSFQQLLEVSLPYAEVSHTGEVVIAKPKDSGGELSRSTCAQQLLYEVGNPSAYITPDLVVDFSDVSFEQLTVDRVIAKGAVPGFCLRPEKLLRLVPQESGWKAWGEISYGGRGCIQRAKAAEYLVLSWTENYFPGISKDITSYLIGIDSLHIRDVDENGYNTPKILDIRLRMDGLFSSEKQSTRFTQEFEALYTNGPAGGGGISTGCKKEICLQKVQVHRKETFWRTCTKVSDSQSFKEESPKKLLEEINLYSNVPSKDILGKLETFPTLSLTATVKSALPAPGGIKIPLYKIAQSRTGDKGNDLNFSLIPHCPADILRLKSVITCEWVKKVMMNLSSHLQIHSSTDASSYDIDHFEFIMEESSAQDACVEIYEVQGIQALNIVVRNVLDGGVNCSRRLDRHGKSLSDLILSQTIILPLEKDDF